jgi:hypothetical protein
MSGRWPLLFRLSLFPVSAGVACERRLRVYPDVAAVAGSGAMPRSQS